MIRRYEASASGRLRLYTPELKAYVGHRLYPSKSLLCGVTLR